jgi:large subunit ribosomal protein L3
MSKFLLGKKIGMTQIFQENGDLIPVTVIQAGPCFVCQKKTPQNDSYSAIQLGFIPVKPKKVNEPLKGHFEKAHVSALRILKEFRVEEKDLNEYEVGQEVLVDKFKAGEYVDITGTSKGRGFAGVIKRHGFHGPPGSHGTHDYMRHGGSIGSSSFPSRVMKGLRMPGRMGCDRITTQNLKVIQVRPEQNCLLVMGAVPGANKGLVLIRSAIKKA